MYDHQVAKIFDGLASNLCPESTWTVRFPGLLQHCKSFVEMCIVSCLSAAPACVCGLVAATWGCPRCRLPCHRDSPAPLYHTNCGWLSFGWLWCHQWTVSTQSLWRGCSGTSERVCCLLVLNSVTFTPQWICQPKAAWGNVCLGPVLDSHATSLTAAAAAAWRGRGRVHIAGWSYDGVGPVRGLRGGGRPLHH